MSYWMSLEMISVIIDDVIENDVKIIDDVIANDVIPRC